MGERSRREPERTVLHRAVQAGWAAFVRSVAAKERSVPRFCQREIEAFLRCGVPAYGVARVHCDGCGADDVVAFSCKGRGICPSCGAARMVDTAAWLCDAPELGHGVQRPPAPMRVAPSRGNTRRQDALSCATW